MGGYNSGIERRQSVNKKGGDGRITVGNESQSKVGKANKNVKVQFKNFHLIQKTIDREKERETGTEIEKETDTQRDRDTKRDGE